MLSNTHPDRISPQHSSVLTCSIPRLYMTLLSIWTWQRCVVPEALFSVTFLASSDLLCASTSLYSIFCLDHHAICIVANPCTTTSSKYPRPLICTEMELSGR